MKESGPLGRACAVHSANVDPPMIMMEAITLRKRATVDTISMQTRASRPKVNKEADDWAWNITHKGYATERFWKKSCLC